MKKSRRQYRSLFARFAKLSLCLFCALCSSCFAEELHIATASNFTATLKLLVTAFEADYPHHKVKSSSGSTGQLFAQIEHAAPFDVLLAADSHYPEQLEQRGLGVAGTRLTYAVGKLVLWSPKPIFSQGLQKHSATDYLSKGDFSRLAIANPKTAPYGLAAQQTLEKLQQWQTLQGKIVRGNNAGQAFQFVASGNAELGFVALSQVKLWQTNSLSAQRGVNQPSKLNSLWLIPKEYYQPITQQAILLKHGKDNPAARDFLRFLQTQKAQDIIKNHGYEVAN